MAGVLSPDWPAKFRSIARWYSKEYVTPLADVYELPIDFILLNYFEAQYEGMEEEERNKVAAEIIQTPEQLAYEKELAQKSEDDFYEQTKLAALSMKNLKEVKRKQVSEQLESLGNQDLIALKPVEVKVKDLPKVTVKHEEFSIGENTSFEELLELDPLSRGKR